MFPALAGAFGNVGRYFCISLWLIHVCSPHYVTKSSQRDDGGRCVFTPHLQTSSIMKCSCCWGPSGPSGPVRWPAWRHNMWTPSVPDRLEFDVGCCLCIKRPLIILITEVWLQWPEQSAAPHSSNMDVEIVWKWFPPFEIGLVFEITFAFHLFSETSVISETAAISAEERGLLYKHWTCCTELDLCLKSNQVSMLDWYVAYS